MPLRDKWNSLLYKFCFQREHAAAKNSTVQEHPNHHKTGNFAGIENLNEMAVPLPIENPNDAAVYRHHDLEEMTSGSTYRASHY